MSLFHNPLDPTDAADVQWFVEPLEQEPALGITPNSFATSTTGSTTVSTPQPAPLTNALYLTEAGDTTAISYDDIHQGQIGDCFLLSSIGEITLTNPSFISNMIKTNANGTETVTLYENKTGALPTFGTSSYKSITETVTNTFQSNAVNNGATQDVVGNQKEIWVQVLEKADAQLSGGYNAISNGGNPMIAMEELTGKAASYMSPASLTQALLQLDSAAKDLIVMDTGSSTSAAYGLVGSHAYMFQSMSVVSGVAEVQLRNPWGTDNPGLIPLSKLASAGIVEVDIGHTS
jgi:hypothetical protein